MQLGFRELFTPVIDRPDNKLLRTLENLLLALLALLARIIHSRPIVSLLLYFIYQ